MRKELLALFLVSLLFFGCCGISLPWLQLSKPVKDLIPSKAKMYIVVKTQKLMADQDITNFIETASHQSLSTLKQNFTQTTGIEFDKVGDMLVFSDTVSSSGTSSSQYTGVLITATYDQATALSKIKASLANQGVTATDGEYKGIKTLTYTQSGQAQMYAFLPGVVAMGSPTAVNDVVDVYKGDAQKLNNALMSKAEAKIDTAAMLYVVADNTQSGATTSGPQMDSVAVSLDKSGSNLNLKAAMAMRTAADASDTVTQLQQGITTMKGQLQGAPQSEAILRVINGITVSSQGDIVIIQATATMSDVQTVMGLFLSSTSSMQSGPTPTY